MVSLYIQETFLGGLCIINDGEFNGNKRILSVTAVSPIWRAIIKTSVIHLRSLSQSGCILSASVAIFIFNLDEFQVCY